MPHNQASTALTHCGPNSHFFSEDVQAISHVLDHGMTQVTLETLKAKLGHIIGRNFLPEMEHYSEYNYLEGQQGGGMLMKADKSPPPMSTPEHWGWS